MARGHILNQIMPKPIHPDNLLKVLFKAEGETAEMLLRYPPAIGETFRAGSGKTFKIESVQYLPWNEQTADVIVEGSEVKQGRSILEPEILLGKPRA